MRYCDARVSHEESRPSSGKSPLARLGVLCYIFHPNRLLHVRRPLTGGSGLSHFMRQFLTRIASAVLLFGFLLSHSDGLLRPAPGNRPPNNPLASCCGTASCRCCKEGVSGDGGPCATTGGSARPEPASGRYICEVRPSGCDPDTGLPQPLANRNLTPPLSRTELSCVPPVSEVVLHSTPSPTDPFKPSVFRPPRA
jgi:hypothetical protein